MRECDDILTHNSIAPSPLLPDRPETRLEDIPIGARFTDHENAFMLGVDNSAGMVVCSQIIGKSIREDIGTLFGKYHASKATIGLKILKNVKRKRLAPSSAAADPKTG